MTAQEVFDEVWKHFITNNAPFGFFRSSNPNKTGTCMLRGANGSKCAVGLFIPDELYTDSLEGKYPDQLRKWLRKGVTEHIRLLGELRTAHDVAAVDNECRHRLKLNLELVAQRYQLTVPKEES